MTHLSTSVRSPSFFVLAVSSTRMVSFWELGVRRVQGYLVSHFDILNLNGDYPFTTVYMVSSLHVK